MKIYEDIRKLKRDTQDIPSLKLQIMILQEFIQHNFECKTKFRAFERDYLKTMEQRGEPPKPPKEPEPPKPVTVHDKPGKEPAASPYRQGESNQG